MVFLLFRIWCYNISIWLEIRFWGIWAFWYKNWLSELFCLRAIVESIWFETLATLFVRSYSRIKTFIDVLSTLFLKICVNLISFCWLLLDYDLTWLLVLTEILGWPFLSCISHFSWISSFDELIWLFWKTRWFSE